MQYQSDLDMTKCKSEKNFKTMSGTKYLIIIKYNLFKAK